MFQYQPMHLSTTIAVNEWFLERAGLRGRALRVLSLGSGPATEALALHVALQAREVDFLGVDYNPNMLGLGRQVLGQARLRTGRSATETRQRKFRSARGRCAWAIDEAWRPFLTWD